MKVSSPLSLLFLLQLASTAPVPTSTDCHSRSCIISLLGSPNNLPPTYFTEPQSREHQLADSSRTSKSITPSKSLSSSFLLSLANPATNPTIQKAPLSTSTSSKNLPAKPTSALSELRAADLRKYWETLRPSASTSPKNTQIHSCEMGTGEVLGSERFYYMRRTRLGTRRDYADFMVVGIVVLFLAVVAALEAVERLGDMEGIIYPRRQRRGEIYLEGDDNLFIVKRPCESSRSQSVDGYTDEKDSFTYDSDANERV